MVHNNGPIFSSILNKKEWVKYGLLICSQIYLVSSDAKIHTSLLV